MQRPRNIRKKPSEDDGDDPGALEIKSRQPRKMAMVQSAQQESSRQLLEQVRDRVYPLEDHHDDQDDDRDEDILLRKRAEIARAKRDAVRQHGEGFPDQDFLALDEAPLGPLEMIAETGVDEEVFEDNRGQTIKFGLSPVALEVADEDLMLEDDESRQWEMDQIQKGMASAGIKADREQRQVVKELAKEAKAVEKTDLIDFGSLDLILTELIEQTDQLETVIANHQTDLKALNKEAGRLAEDPQGTLLAGKLASERAAFHAEMSKFISTFSQFSSEASRLMDTPGVDVVELEAFFEDALTEYSSISSILVRLARWRQLYPSEYADSFVEHQLPFLLEIFVQRQLFSLDLLRDTLSVAELIDRLFGDAEVSAHLRVSLVGEVYIPRLFTGIAAKLDPSDHEQCVGLKNLLADISTHLSDKGTSLDMFKFVLSDMFTDAKRACEPGSDELQRILLNQSVLGIN